MFVSPRESYDGRACDIYSLGILLWRIHSNAFPEVIQSGGDGEVVIPQVSLTGSARDLIAGMIKVTFCAAAVILRSCQRAVLQSRWSGWILLPVSTTLFACQPSGTYCMPYGHDLAIYSTLISSDSIMIRDSLKVNLDPHRWTRNNVSNGQIFCSTISSRAQTINCLAWSSVPWRLSQSLAPGAWRSTS